MTLDRYIYQCDGIHYMGLKRFFSILFVFANIALASQARAAEPVRISFGIIPQYSASELAKRWTPILQYLSEKTGYSIEFKTAKDIPSYQDQMRRGEYDIAYENPYHYVMFHQSPGYQVFANEKGGKLVDIIIVGKDSRYKNVTDLRDESMAFPTPMALTTVLSLAYLKGKGVTVIPKYVSSHESVYRAVAQGLFVVGGGELRTFNEMDPAIKANLRILWMSAALPPFAFVAHPRVPAEAVKRIQQAMVGMSGDAQGQVLLRSLHLKDIRVARDADYKEMENFNFNVPKQ